MAFKTRLDFSNNRQVKQHEATFTILSGGTSFGVPFSALTTGPDPITSGVSQSYFGLTSDFSGTTGMTSYVWSDSRMSLGESYLSAITPSNSGVTGQITGPVFTANTTTVIDGNSVVLDYTGVSFNVLVLTMNDLGAGNYSGTVWTQQLDILSASTLDFTGRTIWVDVSGITRTNELIVTKNPIIGQVLTCIDSEGKMGLMPISGTTDIFITGASYNNPTGTLTLNNSSGSPITVTGFTTGLTDTYWVSGTSGNYSLKVKNDTTVNATGDYAVAEGGNGVLASGIASHAEGSGTTAGGVFSHAEGRFTTAFGQWSHAEGRSSVASSQSAHAEGAFCTASAIQSHAEGNLCLAAGNNSHAEGDTTTTLGPSSHAEGAFTTAVGQGSHVEGFTSTAVGLGTHAEGYNTKAIGNGSHTEGSGTTANGGTSHAEGLLTITYGNFSHAEGSGTTASGTSSHAEGFKTTAIGQASHAEGEQSIASGTSSHAEGQLTIAIGQASHAEGRFTTASGTSSHAEGQLTIAIEFASHAEGSATTAIGEGSHAEGDLTTAIGQGSHAEGNNTIAIGSYSHAEGIRTSAIGGYSHAEGSGTTASGTSSHAEGFKTTAIGDVSHAGGSASTASGVASFIHSIGSIVTGNRSVVLGGQNLTGATDDYVYVPSLNVNSVGSGAFVNDIRIDGNGNLTTNTSDERLKENIQSLTNALDTIKQLRGVTYQWKDRSAGGNAIKIGFIAQEVQLVEPNLVFTNKVDDYMGVHIDSIIPLLVEAIKELSSGTAITTNNMVFETQSILAEDNNIELNYSGSVETAIGGGLTVLHALGENNHADFKTDKEGNWITNNNLKPQSLSVPVFTPFSSEDKNGTVGNITRDDNYLYLKTENGWKRTNLEAF